MEVGYLGFWLGLGFGKNFDLYILENPIRN